LLNWVYKVTLTTLLTMYHSWIHPLHRFSSFSQSPETTVWNRHTGICRDREGFRSTDPCVFPEEVHGRVPCGYLTAWIPTTLPWGVLCQMAEHLKPMHSYHNGYYHEVESSGNCGTPLQS
jgi:hypothetical protein